MKLQLIQANLEGKDTADLTLKTFGGEGLKQYEAIHRSGSISFDRNFSPIQLSLMCITPVVAGYSYYEDHVPKQHERLYEATIPACNCAPVT